MPVLRLAGALAVFAVFAYRRCPFGGQELGWLYAVEGKKLFRRC